MIRIATLDHQGLVEAMHGYDAAASALGPFHLFEARLVRAAVAGAFVLTASVAVVVSVLRHQAVRHRPAVHHGHHQAQHDEGNQFEMAQRQRAAAQAPQGERKVKQVKLDQPKVGRNDPCPCGSGKKFKNCHGKPAR